MNTIKKLVIASGNKGKIAEFNAMFSGHGIDVICQSELDVPPCDEPFSTFIENSLRKARHASSHTQLPALADDSGLIVDALNGRPGVLSARFAQSFGLAKSDAANNECLLKELSQYPDPAQRTACFFTVLTLVRHPDDPAPLVSQAYWRGHILPEPSGSNGFGYDPLFWVPKKGCSAADLDPAQKNQLSHRAQALRKLMRQFAEVGIVQA